MAVLIAVSVAYPVDEEQLSVQRRKKAARFRQKADRKRCLCAGTALDLALQTVGLREKEVQIAYTEQGKPYLVDCPQWHFSLSHSGDWAVCLLSEAPVGVDVEQLRPLRDFSIASRCFTDEAFRQWQVLPEAERQLAFFRQWTRLESALKRQGTGLSGLSSLNGEPEGPFREYPLAGYVLTACGDRLPETLTIME